MLVVYLFSFFFEKEEGMEEGNQQSKRLAKSYTNKGPGKKESNSGYV